MNQQERKSLQFVATRLSAMQQCLNACSAHHSELWTEQESQLAEMNELEQKLKHLQEPYLTDLDFELMLSMSTGSWIAQQPNYVFHVLPAKAFLRGPVNGELVWQHQNVHSQDNKEIH